jgi:hypothetical protein
MVQEIAQNKGTQTGGLIAGGLGGSLLGFLFGILSAKPAAAATPEEQWARLIQLQEGQLAALARLVEIAEKLSGEPGEVSPIVIKAEVKPGMVFVPLDPEGLNGAIQAMRLKGMTMFPQTRLAWAIPAGVTTDLILTVPVNYVDTRRACLITSDFYDPAIVLNIFVDGELVTPQGVAITGATTIDFGEFYVKHDNIHLSTLNGSPVNAVMSLQVVAALMEKSFYDEFYTPIINYMYAQLKEVAGGSV